VGVTQSWENAQTSCIREKKKHLGRGHLPQTWHLTHQKNLNTSGIKGGKKKESGHNTATLKKGKINALKSETLNGTALTMIKKNSDSEGHSRGKEK